jgi:spore coat polysaccharide biosynthesis protein SpsF
MDTQVFALNILKKSLSMTNELLDHEHVTLHIRNNPQLFTKINFVAPPELDWPELGLTLDEQHDYNLLKIIIEHFGQENPFFSCLDVVQFLKGRPELVAINAKVHRKGDS